MDNKNLKKLKKEQDRNLPDSWACVKCGSRNAPGAWKCTGNNNKCQKPDMQRPASRAYVAYRKDFLLMEEELRRKGVAYAGEGLMPFFRFLAERQEKEEEDRIGQMTDANLIADAQSSAVTNSSCAAMLDGARGDYRPGTADMSGMTARHASSGRRRKNRGSDTGSDASSDQGVIRREPRCVVILEDVEEEEELKHLMKDICQDVEEEEETTLGEHGEQDLRAEPSTKSGRVVLESAPSRKTDVSRSSWDVHEDKENCRSEAFGSEVDWKTSVVGSEPGRLHEEPVPHPDKYSKEYGEDWSQTSKGSNRRSRRHWQKVSEHDYGGHQKTQQSSSSGDRPREAQRASTGSSTARSSTAQRPWREKAPTESRTRFSWDKKAASEAA
jgi:ribosomal protein L40E